MASRSDIKAPQASILRRAGCRARHVLRPVASQIKRVNNRRGLGTTAPGRYAYCSQSSRPHDTGTSTSPGSRRAGRAGRTVHGQDVGMVGVHEAGIVEDPRSASSFGVW
jgi:hypothetical protein